MPSSSITAETVTVDGVVLSQKDTAGITTTAPPRSFSANGMVLTQTDGRGNTTTTVTDKAGRALMVTDAASSGQSCAGARKLLPQKPSAPLKSAILRPAVMMAAPEIEKFT